METVNRDSNLEMLVRRAEKSDRRNEADGLCSGQVGRLEVACMCVSCGNGPVVRWKLAVRERGDRTPLKLRNRKEDIPAVPRGCRGGGTVQVFVPMGW